MTQRETRGGTTWREDPVGRHLHARDTGLRRNQPCLLLILELQPPELWFTLPQAAVLCHFPAHPNRSSSFPSRWSAGSFLLSPFLKTSFPLESPPLCCPRSPTGQNLCPPTCVVTCHFFMLSPHPGRCLTPPQDAWERLTGMHSGINMCHSLTELGPTESASQAQFRSQIKATSYWITWFMWHSVLPRGSYISFSILPLLPQLCALHSGRRAHHGLLWWLRQ